MLELPPISLPAPAHGLLSGIFTIFVYLLFHMFYSSSLEELNATLLSFPTY